MQIEIFIYKNIFFGNETYFSSNYFENQIKFKNSFQNSLKLCKITTFNCLFLFYKYKLTTVAFTNMHGFGLVWPRNMNNISNES